MGTRHLLIAGGGGAAKTGVLNNVETFLLTFDPRDAMSSVGAAAKLVNQFSTGDFATMNLDVAPLGPTTAGVYLVAAGHNEYCDIYETTGFSVNKEEFNQDQKSVGFRLREVGRLTTDEMVENAYQKCVRFDRSRPGAQRLLTGGSDGHIRIWDTKAVFENRSPTIEHKPLLDIPAHTAEVDDLDIANDGTIIASVGNGKAILWDTNTGRKLIDLPLPAELTTAKYKVRSLRFTPYAEGRHVFVVAYNPVELKGKYNSYVSLWAFNRERAACRPVVMREIRQEGVSSLCISSCGDFTGVGTLGGSVGVFDTHEMKPLLWKADTHGIFVTGVEFLDRVARDLAMDPNDNKKASALYPGPAATWRAALVSLSADKTVQLHTVPLSASSSLSSSMFWICLILLLSQFTVWVIARYF